MLLWLIECTGVGGGVGVAVVARGASCVRDGCRLGPARWGAGGPGQEVRSGCSWWRRVLGWNASAQFSFVAALNLLLFGPPQPLSSRPQPPLPPRAVGG